MAGAESVGSGKKPRKPQVRACGMGVFEGARVTVERVNCWFGVCERCVVKRLRQGAAVGGVG